ncbi:MAG: YggT family protein [Candidatus Omnitrophica bacterium]|nr:YggT family protein [Candidatus Omnitrophota bacterium]
MSSLFFFIARLIQIYEIVIVIRIVISWIQMDPYNSLVQFIARITDPLLDAVRRSFPFLVGGGIDFSPILVFFLLDATQRVIIRIGMYV